MSISVDPHARLEQLRKDIKSQQKEESQIVDGFMHTQPPSEVVFSAIVSVTSLKRSSLWITTDGPSFVVHQNLQLPRMSVENQVMLLEAMYEYVNISVPSESLKKDILNSLHIARSAKQQAGA